MTELKKLIEGIEVKNRERAEKVEITDIAYDSRRVKKGSLFVALRGLQFDGHQFIPEAISRGAVSVIGEKAGEYSVPFFQVAHAREVLALISARFFQEPSREIPVIGVTGTNGKTTITYLVETLLTKGGYSPAVIGTINYRHGEKIYPASHTTPESYDLQALLRQMREGGADSVVMEVSSHALDQHRVDALHYDICIFTNLSSEHLDYHKNIQDYFKAKRRLFEDLLVKSCKKNKSALFNLDDPFVQQLVASLSPDRVMTFSLSPEKGALIFPRSAKFSLDGISAEIQTPWGKLSLKSNLLGEFNLSNLMAAMGVAGLLGIPLSHIEEALADFRGVPGRLERVVNRQGVHVFVDYAHTPDALKNVLAALRGLLAREAKAHPSRRPHLLVLFGCGGDRDPSKRPLMGKEVACGADWAVVTSDNPRTEDPQEIIRAILPGLVSEGWAHEKDFLVEADRKKAIGLVLQLAREGDVVLIAGKGHEDYQILGRQKIHFDDREVARNWFEKRL